MTQNEVHSKTQDFPTILIEKSKKNNTETTINTYIRGQLLGKGGFATVHEVTISNTNETVACKMVPKERISKSRAKQKLMSEIKIHKFLNHENIVKFLHFFEDQDNLYIILEVCKNQSLRDVLRRRKRLTELETQSYLLSLISALIYLHSNKIIHRDIKLANIFLSEKMTLKLGDFGLATKLEYDGERKKTICGTPNYIAPEILEGMEGHSYECDVWSLGVLMYTILIGKPPYETKDVKQTYRRIKMNLYNFPEKVKISEEAKSLISSILVVDFTKRPTLSEILSHDFFTKNSIPRTLPKSFLAIPPTSSYIQRYETNKLNIKIRACSEENKFDPQTPTTPKRLRPVSKDSRRSSGMTKDVKLSSYVKTEECGLEVWVTHWIDYSKKYGLGYMLSNYCIGAIFNDETNIIADPLFKNLQYISNDQVFNYSIEQYPTELYKKVMLLHLFKKHFLLTEVDSQVPATPSIVFLKKWLAAPHACVFRISNKIVQICFKDGTELLLSSELKKVTYVNKAKKITVTSLNEAMESDQKELTKRLKYSKEILVRMLKQDNNF